MRCRWNRLDEAVAFSKGSRKERMFKRRTDENELTRKEGKNRTNRMLALFSTCIASIKSGRMSPRILLEEKTNLQKEKGTTRVVREMRFG